MMEYARLLPGPEFQLKNAALYYLQRLVSARPARRAVCASIAASINLRHSRRALADATESVSAEAACALGELEREGCTMLPSLLSPQAIEEILEFLRGTPLIGRSGETFTPDSVPSGTTSGDIPLAAALESPHILGLANHPLVLRIALGHLGCLPTISSVGLRWSFPGRGPSRETQRFHRDPDDWRFCKLFLYLTDVDAQSGPHVFIARTHKTSGPILSRLYEMKEIERRFAPENIRMITGPRGTTFMADTHGIHAGLVPQNRPRLLLQIGYSLLPVFAFRYRPLEIGTRAPLDPYINRLLVRPRHQARDRLN